MKNRISMEEIVVFNRQLAALVNAKLPITPGLREIAKEVKNHRLKEVIEGIRSDVESGRSLKESFGKYPRVFSEFYMSMLDAGEKSGNLAGILNQVADYSHRMARMRSRLLDSLAYPVLLATVALAVLIFLITTIIPLFVNLGQEFPVTSGASYAMYPLYRVGKFINSYPLAIVIIIAVIVCLAILSVRLAARSPQGRAFIDRMKLKIPIVGRLTREMSLAVFSRTLGLLLKAGVPVTQALELLARASTNKVMEQAVMDIKERVNQGESVTRAMSENIIFPPTMVWMLSMGENKGKLDEALIHTAEVYEGKAEHSSRLLFYLLGPVLIIVLGVIVAMILVYGFFYPIRSIIWTSAPV
jgi:type IV pilus assembly protein PilC